MRYRSTFVRDNWVDIFAGVLLVPESVVRPAVSALAKSWSIRLYQLLKCTVPKDFSSIIIIIISTTNVLLSQAYMYVTLCDFVILFWPFGFPAPAYFCIS